MLRIRPIRPAGLVFLALAAAASPLLAQAESERGAIVLGQHLYRAYCKSCHGAGAEGDGSLAEYLTVAPTDLTVLAEKNGGEFPLERTIAVIDGREKVRGHGGGDMPAWGEAFQQISDSEEEVGNKVRQLALYLRSIQKPSTPSTE